MTRRKKSIDPFFEREKNKYEKPIVSREYILQQIKKRGSKKFHELIKLFSLKTKEQQVALKRRLRAMVRDQQLQIINKKFSIYVEHRIIEGMLSFDKKKQLWCMPSEAPAILIPQFNSSFVKEGMYAQVILLQDDGDQPIGKILEIISDEDKEIVGRLYMQHGNYYVIPYTKGVSQDILIPREYINNARDQDIVVVKAVPTYSKKWQVVGEIVKIISDQDAPGIEIATQIVAYNLPHEWDEEVVLQEQNIVVPELHSLKNRVDLQHLPFVTIDGEDAKDFDDAVFCMCGKNSFKLYVAIADVSFFVVKNSPIDKEARKRGNSVYFPNYVIPMLPDKLCNNLCSLKPYVPRLVLVCEMQVSYEGKVMKSSFYEAIIKSQARLTYTKAAAIVEKTCLFPEYSMLQEHLENLHRVYLCLFAARQQRGALDFETVETAIIFNENNKVQDIIAKKRNVAHRMIEECMLAANVATAKFLLKHSASGLYRVHEPPQLDKLTTLKNFLEQVGLSLPKNHHQPIAYTELLKRIQHRPDHEIIQNVILRSMCQAVYSHNNVGHFGLAYDAYTHFTSPIRRYPDLEVHRVLKKILHLRLKNDVDKKQAQQKAYEKLALHCSMTERRADDATRDVEKWFKCQFMLQHIGKTFAGVISGVNKFGFFVQLSDIFAEGLVHVVNLEQDYFIYDPIRQVLYGERTRITYALGNQVVVEVMQVDPDRRKIDFKLIGSQYTTRKKTTKTRKH